VGDRGGREAQRAFRRMAASTPGVRGLWRGAAERSGLGTFSRNCRLFSTVEPSAPHLRTPQTNGLPCRKSVTGIWTAGRGMTAPRPPRRVSFVRTEHSLRRLARPRPSHSSRAARARRNVGRLSSFFAPVVFLLAPKSRQCTKWSGGGATRSDRVLLNQGLSEDARPPLSSGDPPIDASGGGAHAAITTGRGAAELPRSKEGDHLL